MSKNKTLKHDLVSAMAELAERTATQWRAEQTATAGIDRAALVAAITADVAYLAEHDRFYALLAVMEATGLTENGIELDSSEYGAVIAALAPGLPDWWLANLAHAARFHRVVDVPNEEHILNPERKRRTHRGLDTHRVRFDSADQAAEELLREAGCHEYLEQMAAEAVA